VDLVHSDRYLGYLLGPGHPTRPVRCSNMLTLVRNTGIPHRLVEPTLATEADLLLVHDAAYVEQVRSGWHDEWDGNRPQLHDLAALIVGGTVDAARRIADGTTIRAFHAMGAKHHAMADTASGFCIYNDMAIAATVLADSGRRVLYLDWDAHHGDGVEALLAHRTDVMTASIHNGHILPGTGHGHRPERAAYNWPLPSGASGSEMLAAVDDGLSIGSAFRPDVVLLAAGADGHEMDPLGQLAYRLEDFVDAAGEVSAFSWRHCQGRLLGGGAGGYLADDWTPRVWAGVFKELASPPVANGAS
jgi:acetoin utilization protein AcuC